VKAVDKNWTALLAGAFHRRGHQLQIVGSIGAVLFGFVASVGTLMKLTGNNIESANEPSQPDAAQGNEASVTRIDPAAEEAS
jgi:hypothetical protein